MAFSFTNFPMNILFLTNWYPTLKNKSFGIFIQEHARIIQSTGNNLVALAIIAHRSKKLWSKQTTDFYDDENVRTILIEIETKFYNLFYYAFPLHYVILRKHYNQYLKKEFRPDIIHSNVIYPIGVIGGFLSKKLKTKHIISEHWSKIKKIASTPILGYLCKKTYLNSDKILPVSQFLQSNIQSSFQIDDSSRFEVVENVIDDKIFNYKPKEKRKNLIKFCTIASWNNSKIPAKQPELLIKSLSEFQKKRSENIHLTIVGDGDKIGNLKKMSKELSVETTFTGFLSKAEIAKIIQQSDFLVHASTIETFGVVVAEAFFTGTPVICSNVGALPELINSENGVLCENRVESWVEAIEKAINKNFNYEKISENSRKKHSKEQLKQKFSNLYSSLF